MSLLIERVKLKKVEKILPSKLLKLDDYVANFNLRLID